jgi:methionyl-tRNA synthetase
MQIARLGNKYLSEQEPWKLLKNNPKRAKYIICTAIDVCAKLAIILRPFLPFTSEKICQILDIKFY